MLALDHGTVIGMQLGFFTMPIHPLDKDWRASSREDRVAFVLADEPGFRGRRQRQLLSMMLKAGRAVVVTPNPNLPDDSVTLDDLCERLIIHGTPERVADEIMKFRGEVGPFGTALYPGHDWQDPSLARRSMTMTAEKALPLVITPWA
jgi:hypothetical protein